MTVRRGSIWHLRGYELPILVISGGMYNDQPQQMTLLAMPVFQAEIPYGWTVQVGDSQFAVIDQVTPFSKARLTKFDRQVGVDALTDVNNMLFKILATD